MKFASFARAACAVAVVLSASVVAPARGAQITITADIFDGSSFGTSYVGPSPVFGYSNDGGADAFDSYGYYVNSTGTLSLQRRAEAFTGLNLFRWFDVFTNNTAAPVSTTVTFQGNLGSDGAETIHHTDAFYMVTNDNFFTDAVIAHVRGNNTWTQANVSAVIVPENYIATFTLTLAPGESAGLLNFAFLAREAIGPTAGDVTLAIARGQELVDSPYLDGLSPAEIASIVNFTVPEPAGLALLGLGSLALLARRRVGR